MSRPLTAAAYALLLAPIGAHAQDLEISFNDHCRECHSFVKDDNRLGPSLYGVVGRKAGTEKGYAYTQSMQDSGITWTEATLDKWIANPDAVIPGNGMSPRPTAASLIPKSASALSRF